MFTGSLIVHITAGFLALGVFWVPLVTKKGGRAHRRAGWVFVFAMMTVAFTAFHLSFYRLFISAGRTPGEDAFSYFLLFIAVLSIATAWHGMRVLRFKKRKAVHRHPVDIGISFLLLGSGLAACLYGFVQGIALITYFPLIGVVLGSLQLYYWLRPPAERMHWIYEHLGSMIGCSIATITAFTVFGAPQLLNMEEVSLFIWILPTFLLLPLIIGFSRHYQRKFNPPVSK